MEKGKEVTMASQKATPKPLEGVLSVLVESVTSKSANNEKRNTCFYYQRDSISELVNEFNGMSTEIVLGNGEANNDLVAYIKGGGYTPKEIAEYFQIPEIILK